MPTIAEYLKYANLQMAAEAFLKDKVIDPETNKEIDRVRYSGRPLIDALIDGNNHASRFTESEATKFESEWEIVAQLPNTTTGFSGTLFRCKVTDESRGLKAGDYVISFRSTEFIDDAARDNEATNKEIKDFGFAFGQLADMEKWYQSLNLPAGAKVDVTGYSLGGHLATAFNLMHQDEVGQVITFNGAGIGKIGDGSLADTQDKLVQMVQSFRDLCGLPTLEDQFKTPEGKQAYNDLRAAIALRNGIPDDAMLSQFGYLMESHLYSAAALAELKQLNEALKAVLRIAEESVRVVNLGSGPDANGSVTSPNDVKASDIAGCSLDYQLAVRLTAKQYDTAALSIVEGAANIWFDKNMGDGYKAIANQYDLVGTETTTVPKGMVANSQYHYGQHDTVFIEDQPLYRGWAWEKAMLTLFLNAGVKLLVNGYHNNDFGDDLLFGEDGDDNILGDGYVPRADVARAVNDSAWRRAA
jgi:pimeloyl-ACP methyl ester carboxylesterase